ncbi:MAG TPA: hypothetical protein VMA34_13735 [Terracidiphilus sp.]|nr:hypothetical protein [Terracidiphilus sp.]
MAVADQIYTNQRYNSLRLNPFATLQQNELNINSLPAVNDATVTNLWFAARANVMVIDDQQLTAEGLAGGTASAIQRPMAVSPMRANTLAPGAGAGGRHVATGMIGAAGGAALWVTELQTGCTVLILDWGGGQFSMLHLQPSQDNQFNSVGQAILNMGDTARSAYQNVWLKQESTTVVQNTGAAPQRYIMIQSMFEASRGRVTQVVGVLQAAGYQFFRQRPQLHGNHIVQQLQWSTWRSYMPYFSY